MSLVPNMSLDRSQELLRNRGELRGPDPLVNNYFQSDQLFEPTYRTLKYSFDSNPYADEKSVQAPIRTKIICTIGPNTQSEQALSDLMDAGMNVVRMNFSHGTHEFHQTTIQNTRRTCRKKRKLCAILLDTKGPEIRTGKLENGNDVTLEAGQEFTLVTDQNVVGNKNRVSVSYENIVNVIEPGHQVLIDDGLMSLKVIRVDQAAGEVQCVVENGGELGQTKGVNLPGVRVDLPALTDKDLGDLAFGVRNNVDFVAASFIRKASDVTDIRRALGVAGRGIKIISKIENHEGLENFDEILEESDGIMVARGDLGVEIPLEHVVLAQKMMIKKCNLVGKLVITATQMLESMVYNPSPTRAEAGDVANAVFDGSDCVMLSGETAKGKYPVNAVQMMHSICREAETATDFRNQFLARRAGTMNMQVTTVESIASSAVKTALDLRASLIICMTETGRSAHLIAKYRPEANILCITSTENTARQALAYSGLVPLLVGSMLGSDALVTRSIATAKNMGMCKYGDLVIVVSGLHEGVSGATNTLKVLTVEF